MKTYSTTQFHENNRGLHDEWLITNGLGSFAASTTSGINTRKYHGLLVSSFNPPVYRRLMVSKLSEELILKDTKIPLTNDLINDLSLEQRRENLKEINKAAFDSNKEALTEMNIKNSNPNYNSLISFNNSPFPTYTYLVEGVLIEKSIFMVYNENITVIKYKILDTKEGAKLNLRPLLNCRDHHSQKLKDEHNYKIIDIKDNLVELKSGEYPLNILWNEGQFTKDEEYFTGMYYPFETYRGESDLDDHYIPGKLEVDISTKKEILIALSTDKTKELKGKEWEKKTLERREELLNKYPKQRDGLVDKLVLAGDAFITYRKSTDKKTIMAGYPWFTDWGRDTMIALPGLTLSTGRYEEAKEILTTFALSVKDGLLPNVFDDISGEAAQYNTVDASLWFFYSIREYYKYTQDIAFIKEIYPKLNNILEKHKKGTLYGIKMDEGDGLLNAGEKGVQLTWMDAKIEDWVVTPRDGKAVEINALWYNALVIFNELGRDLGEEEKNLEIIEKIKDNFTDVFWYEEGQYLYDYINKEKKDSSLRPNQVFVVSLPYSLLDKDKEKKVIDKVYQKLYTPVGLRSLSPDDSSYHPTYKGRRAIRDAAYHQGTVWGWPIGHFFEGYLKVNNFSKEAKKKVRKMYEPFEDHLNHYGIGSISEVFDGDYPHEPRGCPAQAWSVSELLRIYESYLQD
ncbi:amylo-alpha-1,6-glucosidase [Halonatronum saccharophilum]|uniref:amylo-alpha-1,6-glucosidase n=1 Tax=Halonatronum saccharophilum TaxID=150060 RepID=UPI000487134E|nr:amylo-alpha-1,6-glucosidase [Halonatronum saccharophilum]